MTTYRSSNDAIPETIVGDDEWDAFVLQHPEGSLHQTSAWSRVKGLGHDVLRVALRGQDGEIVAGAQMLSRRMARFVGAGYVPYGPLATTSDDADRVVDLLEETARGAGLAALLVQPTRRGLEVEASLRLRGYRQARIDVATSATFLVDSNAPSEKLFEQVSKSKRGMVRKSRRAGLVVRDGAMADLATFHRLLTLSAGRHDFLPMSLEYLERQWSELGPLGYLRLIIGELHDEPVAGALFTVFNGLVDFKLTGWELNDKNKQLGINHGMQWAIIDWASRTGQSTYDLGGMPRDTALLLQREPEDRSIDDAGTRFKSGWGGELRIFPPTYERILHPLGHLTYRLPAALMADEGLGGRLVNRMRRT